MNRRPKLSETFAEGLALAAKERGSKAYFPAWLIACVALGGIASAYIPTAFWSDDKWDVSITLFGGLLAFDGLLIAVGWGAFAKIYEIIGAGEFAAFLRRNGLLNLHFLYIDLAQLSMIFSALLTGLAMVLVLTQMSIYIDRIAFALAVGTSAYSVIKAMGATQAMHELIWESTNRDTSSQNQISAVR